MIRESRTVDGAPLWIWHGALSPAALADLERLFDGYRGELLGHTSNDRDLARATGEVLAGAIALDVKVWAPIVSYGRATKPLGWHFDRAFAGSRWKLFAFLNAPAKGGGTVFGRFSSSICVPPAPGTVVLFSVDIEHRGEAQPADFEKLTIGVRPLKLTLPT